jgi:hypothetical protein
MAYIYLSIAKRKRLGVRKDGFCYYITAWPESLFFVVQSAKIQRMLENSTIGFLGDKDIAFEGTYLFFLILSVLVSYCRGASTLYTNGRGSLSHVNLASEPQIQSSFMRFNRHLSPFRPRFLYRIIRFPILRHVQASLPKMRPTWLAIDRNTAFESIQRRRR